MPTIELERLLTGDWRGAALTALATFGAAAVLALALVALANPEGIDLEQYLTAASLMVSSAFGGDIVTDLGDTDFAMALSIGAYPLTLTVAALGVGSFVFWRRVSQQNLIEALVHAARAGLILGGLLAISSLALRSGFRTVLAA